MGSRTKRTGTAFDAAIVTLPESLQTPTFLQAWYEWCDYRKERKRKISQQACTLQINKLVEYGPAVAIAAIHRSIENDWQGLFPEREGQTNGLSRQPAFSGIRSWAERHSDSLHREYGT